jgi:hypothetical protein
MASTHYMATAISEAKPPSPFIVRHSSGIVSSLAPGLFSHVSIITPFVSALKKLFYRESQGVF